LRPKTKNISPIRRRLIVARRRGRLRDGLELEPAVAARSAGVAEDFMG
jgi:hypothetical protein